MATTHKAARKYVATLFPNAPYWYHRVMYEMPIKQVMAIYRKYKAREISAEYKTKDKLPVCHQISFKEYMNNG